jgi:quinol monooxygenase YgiN
MRMCVMYVVIYDSQLVSGGGHGCDRDAEQISGRRHSPATVTKPRPARAHSGRIGSERPASHRPSARPLVRALYNRDTATSGFRSDASERILHVVNVLTIVSADVDQGRAEELLAAYETLLADGLPDGLLETQLLGDGQGHWAIHSRWRDRAALDAMRAAPEPPAAPALFRRFSAEPALAIVSVLVDSRASR